MQASNKGSCCWKFCTTQGLIKSCEESQLLSNQCSWTPATKPTAFRSGRHKGNLALFLAYFLAIFWHMPGFISGMCQKFYCTILCSQISPKFLAYYRAIIPLWLGTRLGTYFSRDVASHSTSRKQLLCSQKLMPELNFYCSQDSPPEFYFYVARIPRQKFNSM